MIARLNNNVTKPFGNIEINATSTLRLHGTLAARYCRDERGRKDHTVKGVNEKDFFETLILTSQVIKCINANIILNISNKYSPALPSTTLYTH